ncbi:MAG: S-methyl-5-thioribose-1-phosphate isomerase [Sphaerochaeta sp.]|jgi:methylthioribose-1-phosphate isomerase|nr:S-methyl-5-thioribose-1-phosphate isomerase [Sphaerochaeta sp.]MCI2045001.1 S-methyl-5-thioribose-1-phosphate isomerase [Sphaerochaeta sp.]
MDITNFETVTLDEASGTLLICDQTKLPGEVTFLSLSNAKDIWNAIYLLQVRGAPAIGVAAAIGLWVVTKDYSGNDFEGFYRLFVKEKEYLKSARPTAVNLSWALERMHRVCLANKEKPVGVIKEILHQECVRIREEDIAVCHAIGEYGLTLIKDGDGLLTHCNAGRLATVKYGTATAPMYLGAERGMHLHIYADETRPLLQGARLTAFELHAAGLDVTLECDNMSASAMREGKINAVFVGCDRVAANGDFANKIGTSMVALAAKRYGIPFYCCAPTSTIDLATPDGTKIPIEQRPAEEVTTMWYQHRMAPEGIKVYNPSFDVTDHDLVTAFVTEKGIARAPFSTSLARLCSRP